MENRQEGNVPEAVIKRLPRYYRYLSELLAKDIVRISSSELSKLMSVTASQIRQDFNKFGGFGQQGYGYNVEALHREIGKILGTDCGFKLIVIGTGNLGHAILNYTNLKKRGFSIVGLFDTDTEIIGREFNGLTVMPMEKLEEFCSENSPDIAVLTIPKMYVEETVNKLNGLGIKGVWNFSYSDFSPEGNIAVENVHLSDSLMLLSYKISKKK